MDTYARPAHSHRGPRRSQRLADLPTGFGIAI
jgi:hypothetical protein